MKKLMDEFKEFISRGNVMDMAVGVIVGGAFTAIVNSLIDDIINPLISLLAPVGEDGEIVGFVFYGINIGGFISAILNFLIVSLIVFAIVKAVNKLKDVAAPTEPEEEEAPAPVCPHCLEEVKEGATRCPHCAGVIE